MLIKIVNNKVYNSNKDAIFFSKLRARWIEVAKNDILKNQGACLRFFEVKSHQNDPAKVMIRNNILTESFASSGIVIENSSLTLEHNDIKKNTLDGINITGNNYSMPNFQSNS